MYRKIPALPLSHIAHANLILEPVLYKKYIGTIIKLHNLPFDYKHLQVIAWNPEEAASQSKSARDTMGDELYEQGMKEYNDAVDDLIFEDIVLDWDTCDCGQGYGCSHGSWVYRIGIGEQEIYTEGDTDFSSTYYTKGTKFELAIRQPKTIGEFIDDCYRAGIEIFFTKQAYVKYFNLYDDEVLCKKCGQVTGPAHEEGCQDHDHPLCAWHIKTFKTTISQ